MKEVGHEEHHDEAKTTQALTDYYYDIITNPDSKQAFRDMAKQESERALQDSPEREIFSAEFDACIFQFNSYGTENAATTHHGVINVQSPSNKLIVRNSVFHENDFGDKGITVRDDNDPLFTQKTRMLRRRRLTYLSIPANNICH